jgi:predicted NBD/HSP70 family sugar kinase
LSGFKQALSICCFRQQKRFHKLYRFKWLQQTSRKEGQLPMEKNSHARGFVGRTREDVRQFNLSIVLRMLHFSGSVSRSQLTSISGLNRSTISDLVSELEELGLVTESEGSTTSSGRPSHVVSASDAVVAFAVNPDIDATTVGVVTLGGRVLSKRRILTRLQPSADQAIEIAANAINEMRAELKPGTLIAGVGVAIPGQVRLADGVVRLAPHLNWVEAPLGSKLAQLTSLPVSLDNDASLGCMAEFNFGAARGFNDVVYVFSGSGGVGGGAIVNGRQLRGAAGYAGELGHVRITDSKANDYSGLAGTVESVVRRDDLLEVFMLDSATDEELAAEVQAVKRSQNAKTKAAQKLIERQIDALAMGLASFVNIFNPQVIVLAGFLASLFEFDKDRMLAGVKKNSLEASSEAVLIRSADLGADLLMIGAAELPFASLLARPSEFEFATSRRRGSKA